MVATDAAACEGLYRGRGERVPRVERIAVLRANAVGDLVVALPALHALRRAYPQARISLLARDWHRRFLEGRPSPVDEVIVLPASIDLGAGAPEAGEGEAQADAEEAGAFLAQLRDRRFDIALQLHGGGVHSNPFVRALGARVSAGLCARDAPPLDRNLTYRALHPEVLRLLEAVALVGAHGCEVEPRLAVIESDRIEAAQALEAAAALQPAGALHVAGALQAADALHAAGGCYADDAGGRADRWAAGAQPPLLVLQPGCTDPRRAWPAESFAAIGDHCARRGARVVLNGTAAEAPTLARVRAAMREPVTDLAGVLSLGGLLGLLERARLLVSNDTGTAHLARAIDLPSVTICWIGNLASYGPMSCERHAVALSWQVHCPRCGRLNVADRCEHDDSFVATVGSHEVLALVDDLWAASEPAPNLARRGA